MDNLKNKLFYILLLNIKIMNVSKYYRNNINDLHHNAYKLIQRTYLYLFFRRDFIANF